MSSAAEVTLSAPSYVEKFVEDELNPPPESTVSTVGLAVERFLDRELSWLDFNARVLEIAEDRRPSGRLPGGAARRRRNARHHLSLTARSA